MLSVPFLASSNGYMECAISMPWLEIVHQILVEK